MIVDTSAIIAILRREPEGDRFQDLIAAAKRKFVSAGSWIELGAVLSKPGAEAYLTGLQPMIDLLGIEIAPVTTEQARIGHAAYLRYGKGRDPARLNFGDCFAYALARETGLPLLFKGDDFAQTDVLKAA